MNRSDRLISLILLVLSVCVIVYSNQFPVRSQSETGPAFFPQLISYFMILLSLILFLKSFFVEDRSINFERWKSLLISVGIMTFYVIGFLYIGFVVTSTLSLVAFMWIMNIRRPLHLVTVSISSSVIVYVLFTKLFQVPLPQGIFI